MAKKELETLGYIVSLTDMPKRWKQDMDYFNTFDIIAIKPGEVKFVQVKTNSTGGDRTYRQTLIFKYGSTVIQSIDINKGNNITIVQSDTVGGPGTATHGATSAMFTLSAANSSTSEQYCLSHIHVPLFLSTDRYHPGSGTVQVHGARVAEDSTTDLAFTVFAITSLQVADCTVTMENWMAEKLG